MEQQLNSIIEVSIAQLFIYVIILMLLVLLYTKVNYIEDLLETNTKPKNLDSDKVYVNNHRLAWEKGKDDYKRGNHNNPYEEYPLNKAWYEGYNYAKNLNPNKD